MGGSAPPALAALRALRDGDRARAAALAGSGTDPLSAALARHLGRVAAGGVYDEASAFAAFIGGGGNPELYRRTVAVLGAVHADLAPRSVLDVGCGDGRVTAGVLRPPTRRLDLVEPSADLLARARAALAGSPAAVHAHGTGIAEFLASPAAGEGWDLVQATFALHAVPPPARADVLRALAARTGRLAIAEFDVPRDVDDDARLARLAERYAIGVAEYSGRPEAVDGFLMPVLAGQVEPGGVRHTWEQPAAAWAADLRAAGFADIAVAPLHAYWWAPAVLLTASPPP